MKYAGPFFLMIAIALCCSCATVKLSQDERDALKVLQRYVQLDRSGARLDGKRYHSMAALSVWKDEPGWDMFVVTSGLGIGRPQTDGATKVTAYVRYDVEGVMEADTFTPVDLLQADTIASLSIGEPIQFVLEKTADGWKIVSPQIPPHVGFPVARALAQELGAEGTLSALSDAEYIAKLKGARAGHCNCERLDF
jgi:hypothetical protein